ncbi:MAG: hypothetical protein KDD01_20970 [Phaeodactylibacter sp.]|nr:hypothetical protein [Phaeodactylibacter sp.]
MKGKKLFILLSALDAEEFTLLGRAVRSPLMNTNQRVVALYEYFQSFYPLLEGPELEGEVLFSCLFPDEAYNDYKLRRLISSLSQLVEQFLVYLEAKREEQEAPLLLIRALGRRNLHNYFEKKSMEVLDTLDNSPYRDLDYYNRKVEVFTNYYFHPFTDKRAIEPGRLQELVNDMDYSYALKMYRLGNELRNRERIFSEQYQLTGIDALTVQYGDGILSENVVFRTYRSLFNAYQDEENPVLFREFKENFITHIDEMGQDDRNLLFQQLLNYTIRRINQGDSSYYREALGLYRMGLKNELLIDGGRMSEATYSNIVMVSCEEGAYDWAKSFIEQYENLLDDEAKEDTVAHCFSLWHYFQGQHDKALQVLSGHRFSGPFLYSSRMTAIRIIFEQFLMDRTYYDLLLSQCKAFEKFLRRDTSLSRDRNELHKNTSALIRKIATAIYRHEPVDEVKKWALAEMNSGQAFVLRNWLQNKMLQLTALPT